MLKVLASYRTPHEAALARAQLGFAGIASRLGDEATAGWAWIYSDAIGGVELLVADEDVEAAAKVLQIDGATASSPSFAAPASERVDDEADDITCPDCGELTPAAWDACWKCGAETPVRPDVPATSSAPTPAPIPGGLEPEPAPWRCAHCEAESPDNFYVCWSCGTTREEPDDSIAESYESAAISGRAAPAYAVREESDRRGFLVATATGGYFPLVGIFSFCLFLRKHLPPERRSLRDNWILRGALLIDILLVTTVATAAIALFISSL